MIGLPVVGQDAAVSGADRVRAALASRINGALESPAMEAIRSLLGPLGLTIEPDPILHKYLSQRHLRLIFPVVGDTVRLGTVISVVCLYDCTSEETLYAHPMHAGPNVNPLLKHLDGPLASPKAQPGKDGDRATARMIAHKKALWRRYLRDVDGVGLVEASKRWRRGYYWALKRLYFCTRCSFCRWGTPFFDGPDPGNPPKKSTHRIWACGQPFGQDHSDAVKAVCLSELWEVERNYARRGGFEVSECPRIVRRLTDGFLQLIFPTNAVLIQGGSLVGLSVLYSTKLRKAVFAHCLAAGPEPEIQFLLGDEALGMPAPCREASPARARYVAWRDEAWSQFWLDELEHGIGVATQRWLRGFWRALEDLFGGNDMETAWPAQHALHEMPDGPGAHSVVDNAAGAYGAATNGQVWTPPAVDVHERRGHPAIPLGTLENTGATCFAGHAAARGTPELRAIELSTLMVNLGKRCNQTCGHCHVDAGPHRMEEMSRETVDQVLDVLRRHDIDTLDITGGAPEMNPHFRYLASTASGLCRRVIDRCNLTILVEPGYEDLPEFLAEHRIEITASLPSYRTEEVARQRGPGVFEKSIETLKALNALGYGVRGTGLVLNLVYNPVGTDLAPPQLELERRFKRELRKHLGITFNRLFAMNNMLVNRFRDQLVRHGKLEAYMEQLVGAFNPSTVDGFMCRHSLAIGWDGRLYDCDFNYAANLSVLNGLPNHIRDFDAAVLRTRAIKTAAHCFGCAAGYGSSCSGALVSTHAVSKESRRNGRGQEIVTITTCDSRKPT